MKKWIIPILLVIGLICSGAIVYKGTFYIEGGTIDNAVIGGTTPAAISGTTISGTGVMTVSPDGTNEVFQVNDGTIDFTDGNAGTTGTLTVDASGNWSYNKNISIGTTDLDGEDWESVTWDFSQFDATDPDVSLEQLMAGE